MCILLKALSWGYLYFETEDGQQVLILLLGCLYRTQNGSFGVIDKIHFLSNCCLRYLDEL